MKMKLWIIPLVMLITVCSTTPSGTRPLTSPITNPATSSTDNSDSMMTLDQALKEAAVRIDERLTARTKIAPLNFNSPHDKFSGYVLDEVTANLVDSRKLTVVDRKEIDLIRGEFDFQFSGEVGDDSMQALGRMLGAQSIISGSLTDMGGFYRIVIRVLNVQNASVEVQYRANIASDTVTAALLTGGKTAVVAVPQRTSTPQTPVTQNPVPTPAPATQPDPVPTPTTYKVGDTGPAGGIVFFDKGYVSDGWQYLEAASRDALTAHWGPHLNGTREGIGTGKQNTEIIVRTDDTGTAAHRCREYRQGGYNDWFLPSKDELNLMYQNLKQKGLGIFSNVWYWSSSGYYSSNAYCHHFGDGRQTWNSNGNTYAVRPIRAF